MPLSNLALNKRYKNFAIADDSLNDLVLTGEIEACCLYVSKFGVRSQIDFN